MEPASVARLMDSLRSGDSGAAGRLATFLSGTATNRGCKDEK